MTKQQPLTDDAGEVRELTADDLDRFRPTTEVLPESLQAKIAGRARGAQRAPTKERITIRLSRDVLEQFRATGAGWQARVDLALKEWLGTHMMNRR